MSSLSLQDNICGRPHSVYLYTVKIENFRHTLMSSPKLWHKLINFWGGERDLFMGGKMKNGSKTINVFKV